MANTKKSKSSRATRKIAKKPKQKTSKKKVVAVKTKKNTKKKTSKPSKSSNKKIKTKIIKKKTKPTKVKIKKDKGKKTKTKKDIIKKSSKGKPKEKIDKTKKKSIKPLKKSKKVSKEVIEEPKIEVKVIEMSSRQIKNQRKKILHLDIVRRYLINKAGEHAIVIVQNLVEPTTDEELSKKLKVRVSEIRSALNRLHAMRITDYSRSKDSETGWYTYKWIIRHNNVVTLLNVIEEELAEKMKDIPKSLYLCENCWDEAWSFEEAMDMKFKCPRCGTILTEATQEFKEKLKNLYL